MTFLLTLFQITNRRRTKLWTSSRKPLFRLRNIYKYKYLWMWFFEIMIVLFLCREICFFLKEILCICIFRSITYTLLNTQKCKNCIWINSSVFILTSINYCSEIHYNSIILLQILYLLQSWTQYYSLFWQKLHSILFRLSHSQYVLSSPETAQND